MTGRHIHWCMVCNLLTLSKRCPICRNEVFRLDLQDGGVLIPLSQTGIDAIRSSVDDSFGDGCGELLVPDDCVSFIDRKDDVSDIIVNGGKVGRITNGKVMLNPSGLRAISGRIVRGYVRCNHDSSYFVRKGRNLMVTGMIAHSSDLVKGDQVAVLDDKGEIIAVGTMKMSSEEMKGSDRGVAVGIRSTEFSRTCYGIPPHDWMDTIDRNRSTVESAVGMSVKEIKELMSSYGGDVAVSLNGDIRTEASLLLTIDAGYSPKVIVERKDDFIDYLIDRHGLAVMNGDPDRCLVITEKNDGFSSKTVTHWPIKEWEPSLIWVYIMLKKEPFSHYYINISLNNTKTKDL